MLYSWTTPPKKKAADVHFFLRSKLQHCSQVEKSIQQGTLLEERAVSLGDHPGEEAIVEATVNDVPVKFKILYTLVQYRYYQITVGIPRDRTFTSEMDAFLQSFALLEDW